MLALGWAARTLALNHRLLDLIAIAIGHAWPIGALAAILALLLRRWKAALILSMVSLGLGLPIIAPALRFRLELAPTADLSLLLCNAQGLGGTEDALAAAILRESPDVVVLVEVYDAMANRLAARPEIALLYPHTVLPRRGLAWPIVILSRFPLHELTLELPPGGDLDAYQQLFAFRRSQIVDAPAGRFILTAVHAPSPRTDETWANGNEVVAMLAELYRHRLLPLDRPTLIAGDFNTTPLGGRASLLRKLSGLHCDAAVHPFAGSWPDRLPSPLRLPLDQVWHSTDTVVTARTVLEDVGSDHRPVLLHIALND